MIILWFCQITTKINNCCQGFMNWIWMYSFPILNNIPWHPCVCAHLLSLLSFKTNVIALTLIQPLVTGPPSCGASSSPHFYTFWINTLYWSTSSYFFSLRKIYYDPILSIIFNWSWDEPLVIYYMIQFNKVFVFELQKCYNCSKLYIYGAIHIFFLSLF